MRNKRINNSENAPLYGTDNLKDTLMCCDSTRKRNRNSEVKLESMRSTNNMKKCSPNEITSVSKSPILHGTI